MSVYNTSMLKGTALVIVQNLNIMAGGWLGLFLVYVPSIIAFIVALRDSDNVSESLVTALTLAFGISIVLRLMELVDDYIVLVNILLLAMVSGYLYYKNR